MFYDVMGLVIADNKRISLGELTRPRALAATPFAGRYRFIDFMLSNMVNSDIGVIGVVTFNKYRSLMDHLGTGRAWDLTGRTRGLFLLPPFAYSISGTTGESSTEYDGISGIVDFLRSHRHEQVIVASSNVLFNHTFQDFIQRHTDSGADVSVLFNRDGIRFGGPVMILETDRAGWVRDVLATPAKSRSNRSSMGVVILRRQLLIDLLTEAVARREREFSVESILHRHADLRIMGVESDWFTLRINSVQGYFAATMRLLEDDARNALFWSGLPVFTKVKDIAPALYGSDSQVSNSMISDGCRIHGTVSDSLLFRGVTVARDSRLESCIILQDSYISENCRLENVIVDKYCTIRPGVRLVGTPGFPMVIGKGAVV